MMNSVHESRFLPAGQFGSHLAHLPAGRGYLRNTLSRDAESRIPRENPAYHFPAPLYLDFITWWNMGEAEPLLITGPAGSGKTSAVLEFAARLSVPVVSYTARPRMDRRELVGRWVLAPEGGMRWIDGPAALAWKHGWLLLVNEFSAAPAETWVSANDLLEGLPLENDQTGERIERHPDARIVFTDNTRGHSSEAEAGYFGREMQDRSVIDRLWHIRFEGLAEDEEAEVLMKEFPPELVHEAGAESAMEVARILARAGAETRASSGADALGLRSKTIALSHRVLRRTGTLMLSYIAGRVPELHDPVEWSLDCAAGHALDRPVRNALITYMKTVLGTRLAELRNLRREANHA